MRKIALILSIIVLAVCGETKAQQPAIGCVDKAARLQSQKIKSQFLDQGMEVYRDAMLEMENRQPYPIAVQLSEKQLYQLIFVGSDKASKITMELYNGKDEKIAEKELTDPSTLNYFIYSFAPPRSDVYLIILTQKFKGKTVCSSFTIMQNKNGVLLPDNTSGK